MRWEGRNRFSNIVNLLKSSVHKQTSTRAVWMIGARYGPRDDPVRKLSRIVRCRVRSQRNNRLPIKIANTVDVIAT
jgi:hypothetical protein